MKNLKKIVSLVMVVAIVATIGAAAFASSNYKTDDVSDWQYGMLNDLSSGVRALGQKPALTVSPASAQAKIAIVATEVIVDLATEEKTAVEVAVEEETVVVSVPVAKASVSANPFVNEWQEAIINDLSTGVRKVGQNAPITVYKDANTVLNPGTATYDYIAWK